MVRLRRFAPKERIRLDQIIYIKKRRGFGNSTERQSQDSRRAKKKQRAVLKRAGADGSARKGAKVLNPIKEKRVKVKEVERVYEKQSRRRRDESRLGRMQAKWFWG